MAEIKRELVAVERHPETAAEKAVRERVENEAKIKALGPDPVSEPGYVPEAPRVTENPAPVEGVPNKLGEGEFVVVEPAE